MFCSKVAASARSQGNVFLRSTQIFHPAAARRWLGGNSMSSQESFFSTLSSPKKRVRSIILIRHGESLGNVDERSYGVTADWQIPLTPRGRRQARAAGREINHILTTGCGGTLEHPGNVFFYVSPYLRTRQTLRGILMEVDRERVVGIREEPRISEQQFGTFHFSCVDNYIFSTK